MTFLRVRLVIVIFFVSGVFIAFPIVSPFNAQS